MSSQPKRSSYLVRLSRSNLAPLDGSIVEQFGPSHAGGEQRGTPVYRGAWLPMAPPLKHLTPSGERGNWRKASRVFPQRSQRKHASAAAPSPLPPRPVV